jgi:hypothetical protein
MTTADWALVISLFSLLVAMASFVWNVWSKFIFPKPSIAVSFMLMRVHNSDPIHRYLSLNVTNFGPGDITIDCAVVRPIRPWYKRRVALGMLNPLNSLDRPNESTGPFGGGLPKRLATGETFALNFPYAEEMFLKEPWEAIGVHDTFRRSHWAPRSDFLKTMEKYRVDFPQN